MKNRVILLMVSIVLAGFSSQFARAETSYHEAQVLESTPIYRVIETSVPTRQCREVEVLRSTSRHHYRSHTPGLLGAVIGGAIGHSLGNHKSTQNVGTVVGAMLGSSIARDIVRANSADAYRLETVERCETVTN